MTQREVGKLLGRSHSFLSKCETGERSIEVFELLQIAEIYKKPPHYFLDLAKRDQISDTGALGYVPSRFLCEPGIQPRSSRHLERHPLIHRCVGSGIHR